MCPILKNRSLPSRSGGSSPSGRYGRMPAQAVMTAPACRAFTTAFFRALRTWYYPDTIGMQNALCPPTRIAQGWSRAPFCVPKVSQKNPYSPACRVQCRISPCLDSLIAFLELLSGWLLGDRWYRFFWRAPEWQKRMTFLTQRVLGGGIIRRFLPRLFPGRTSTIGLNVHSVT